MADNRDQIRIRLLSQLDDKYDKNPGNLPFELCQGEAIESESIRIMLEDALNQRFAITADFEHLKIIASERGIDWKEATYAEGVVKLTGSPNASVNIGDLVASKIVNYIIQENATINNSGFAVVKVKCEQAGSIGNTGVNTITQFPKSLTGINSVTNESAFTNGYEAETQKALLERYLSEVRHPGASGNPADYEKWALSINGIGYAKCKSTWNGPGTVKVVIMDNTGAPASQELINNVSSYIESVRPIGPTVTVTTVTGLNINIVCTITLESGFMLDSVKQSITAGLEEYYKGDSFKEGTVQYARVGNIIFSTTGVKNIDYSTLTINGSKNDIILIDDNTQTQHAKVGILNITT
nr:MAG: baseplate J-like protein [Bacteriophage sp.]